MLRDLIDHFPWHCCRVNVTSRFSNTKVYILNHYFILPTLFHTPLYLLVVVNITGITIATDSFCKLVCDSDKKKIYSIFPVSYLL